MLHFRPVSVIAFVSSVGAGLAPVVASPVAAIDEFRTLRAALGILGDSGFTLEFTRLGRYSAEDGQQAVFAIHSDLAPLFSPCFEGSYRPVSNHWAWARWDGVFRIEDQLVRSLGPRFRARGVMVVTGDRAVQAQTLLGEQRQETIFAQPENPEHFFMRIGPDFLAGPVSWMTPLVVRRGLDALAAAADRTVSPNSAEGTVRVRSDAAGLVFDLSPDQARLVTAYFRRSPGEWDRVRYCFDQSPAGSSWPSAATEWTGADPDRPDVIPRQVGIMLFHQPRAVARVDQRLFDPNNLIGDALDTAPRGAAASESTALSSPSTSSPPASAPPSGSYTTPWSQPAGWQINHYLLLAGGIVTLSGAAIWMRQRLTTR